MARLCGPGQMLLIGAQISDTVRHIKSEMAMHIQINAVLFYTCKRTDTWSITRGLFNANS